MKTIVLLGAGHANLEVLKSLVAQDVLQNKFVLISTQRTVYYSGLLPRLIMGEIKLKELSFDIRDYAIKKKVSFIERSANEINLEQKIIGLKDDKDISFDLLSINIGGTPKKIESKVVSRTVYLKPFSQFFEYWHEIEDQFSSGCVLKFVVVGGGAAAFETAVALKIRLHRHNSENSEVHLVTRGQRICENYSKNISKQLLRSLLKLKIKIHFNEDISTISDKYVDLKNSDKLFFDYIFVSTPIAPPKLAITPSVRKDSSGFFVCNKRLELASGVFASGDCASFNNDISIPKSGVVAVHQGRLLIKNLVRKLKSQELLDFKAGKKMLNILNDGEYSARLVWGDISFNGRLIYYLKKWIDERYVKMFKTNI